MPTKAADNSTSVECGFFNEDQGIWQCKGCRFINSAKLWGNNNYGYTFDSNVCLAGVHAGFLKSTDAGGKFRCMNIKSIDEFTGTYDNTVQSKNYKNNGGVIRTLQISKA